MAERDKLDWIRITLMTAYMGIVTTIFIIGLFEAGIILFFILVLSWTIPFVFLMALGEWIKTRNLPFYIAVIGFAVIAGLFFGYSKFFLEDDLLIGIFTTTLFAIMVSYIVLRWIDTDDRRQSSVALMPVLAIVGGLVIMTTNLDQIMSAPYLQLPFMALGGICITMALLFGFYGVYKKSSSPTDGYRCSTKVELKCKQGSKEVTVDWNDDRTPAQCNKPFTSVVDPMAKEKAKNNFDYTECEVKNRKPLV